MVSQTQPDSPPQVVPFAAYLAHMRDADDAPSSAPLAQQRLRTAEHIHAMDACDREHNISAWFADHGEAANTHKRDNLVACEAFLLGHGAVRSLVTWSVCLLGRTAIDAALFCARMDAAGVRLVTVKERIDTACDEALLRYNEALVSMTPAWRRRSPVIASSGEEAPNSVLGRYTPFGWRIGHMQGPYEYRAGHPEASRRAPLAKSPAEQDLLAQMLEGCDGTSASAYALSRAFAERGVLNPRQNKPFSAGSIMMIYRHYRRRAESANLSAIATAMRAEGPHA